MHRFLIAIVPTMLFGLSPSPAIGQATDGSERAREADQLVVVAVDAQRVGATRASVGAARVEPGARLLVPHNPDLPTGLAETWTSEHADRFDHAVPAPAPSPRRSGWRSVGWGMLFGAIAGTVTGVAVEAACDSYCDGTHTQGVALHIGVGAALGGVVGGLVHRMRE